MKRGAQGWGERRAGGCMRRGRGRGGIWGGTHTHPPNHFCGSITRPRFAPRGCVCPAAGGPFPAGTQSPTPASRTGARPGGDFGKEQAEMKSGCEAELPRRLRRLRSGAGGLSAAASRAEVQALVRKGKKKKITLFSPHTLSLCLSRDCPPSPPPLPKPIFSITSFDEILQHRNLQPSSAQDFLGVFWQDPVPAIQIGPSDNKLRAATRDTIASHRDLQNISGYLYPCSGTDS